jgi:hypothetical protein
LAKPMSLMMRQKLVASEVALMPPMSDLMSEFWMRGSQNSVTAWAASCSARSYCRREAASGSMAIPANERTVPKRWTRTNIHAE